MRARMETDERADRRMAKPSTRRRLISSSTSFPFLSAFFTEESRSERIRGACMQRLVQSAPRYSRKAVLDVITASAAYPRLISEESGADQAE